MPFPNANFTKQASIAAGQGIGTPADSGRIFWRAMIDHLLAFGGQTLVENGDGLAAFSNSALVITQDPPGANGVNDGAWVSMVDGDGIETLMEFDADGGVLGPSFGYATSPADGFTGGTATVLPTAATDQGEVSNRDNTGNPTYASLDYVIFGYAESVSPFRFGFFFVRDNAAGGSNFDRARCFWGMGRGAYGAYTFPEDDGPADKNIYFYGHSNPFSDSAETVPNNLNSFFAFSDTTSPATAANFAQLKRHTQDGATFPWRPPGILAGTPSDNSGVTSIPLQLARQAVTKRPFPQCLDLMWKGNQEADFGCRVYEMDTDLGGTLDTPGDAIALNNLIIGWELPQPWINLSPDFTSTTGISAIRLYSPKAVLGLAPSGETDPPVLSALLPVDASEITKTTQISFTLADATKVSLACIFLKYVGQNRTIMIYDSNGFRFPFSAQSSVVDVNSDLTQLDFKLNALGGWEADIEELVVIANDGNILTVI